MHRIDRRLGAFLSLALVAFASNSILCREALLHSRTDAYSFTLVRLGSGAFVLWLLAVWERSRTKTRPAGVRSLRRELLDAAWLALYALPFSLAYRRLETGTGALVLFGSVQLTMLLGAILAGERPHAREWVGLAGAFGGLAYLVSPGVHAPNPIGAVEMAAAGVGWGLYTLSGRKSHGSAIARNGRSFLLGALLLAPLLVVFFGGLAVDRHGLALAVASGATASGIGYALWYAALPSMKATSAALAQLLVPIITAFGGVLLLGEHVTLRLALASLIVLGALAFARSNPARSASSTAR